MKQKNKSIKRQYKMDLKRFAIYWVIAIPFVFAFVVGLAFTTLSSPLRIFLAVLFGFVFCLMCELFHYFVLLKRKDKPQKADPFAD